MPDLPPKRTIPKIESTRQPAILPVTAPHTITVTGIGQTPGTVPTTQREFQERDRSMVGLAESFLMPRNNGNNR